MESQSETSSDEEEDKETSNLVKYRKEEEKTLLNNSTTEPKIPLTRDQKYYYVPISHRKPCLYTCALFEDLRKRLYHTNILENIADTMVRLHFHLLVSSKRFKVS